MQESCRLGPWAARPRVACVTAFRKRRGVSDCTHPPPSTSSPRSPATVAFPRLSDLTHLSTIWSTAGLPGGPQVDQPAGVLLFSKIDGLSDLQALRLPPPPSGREGAQQEMKKPRAPFWEDDE